MVLRNQLQAANFEVSEAEDGLEALGSIQESPPDLILLDLLMPRMDGLECCRRIRRNPASQDLPVIIITSLGNHAKEHEAYSAGCDLFLTKPVPSSLLLGKIRQLLQRRECQLANGEPQ